jgi:hypothetical protein
MIEVKKIYGSKYCKNCANAKKLYSNAEYFDIDMITKDERDILIDKSIKVNLRTLPVLLDENNDIIQHKDGKVIE